MPELDKRYFERVLAERETELFAVLKHSGQGASVVELDQSRVGRLSRMDAMQVQAMSVETVRRAEVELRQIQAAKKRLQAGDYGECQQCGQQIVSGRLKINPAAQYCIGCANRNEQGE